MTETKPARRYAGADWVRANYGELSSLGEKVADVLGELFQGIYHLNRTSLGKVEWDNELLIAVVVTDNYMATWDFAGLTRLVIMCHDRCLRCHVQAAAPGYLRLMFHQRQREGSLSERHPTMEQALAQFRATEVA